MKVQENRVKTNQPPRIIPRSEHIISRDNISENALKVLYRLKKAGYESYLVGGGVRDLLLGREPKDFDVATDASPEEVRALFRNCRLIGRRFRLAHVHFGREIVEVATFRGQTPDDEARLQDENGRLLRDNVYGTIEEDAWRRDFTINALYYNIRDFSVVDYVGGMEDLEAGCLRLIGDPETRYREDPVRMLRVVRFATKLGFRIDPETEAPLFELGHLLDDISPSRLFDETVKMFLAGNALQTFEMLRHYDLFRHLFPQTEEVLAREEEGFPLTLVARALENTDLRVAEGKPVTPFFLYAALLWEPVRSKARDMVGEEGISEQEALRIAANLVISKQSRSTAIPRRFSLPMREIWEMQSRFEYRVGKRPLRLLTHPRFRAAYDFLLLRAQCGEESEELAAWWTEFQEKGEDEQRAAIRPAGKKRRRRRRRRPRSQGEGGEAAPQGGETQGGGDTGE
ncbi:MAG TPA: polynucleotide adenylyltransferase PcnB [Thiotrichales bacterium]|nr:polynucleotide adenylyltransferase PcnB [Thiotrichales bacterium]